MEGFLLQDWITLAGAGSVSIVQGQPFWFDASPYRDAMAWLDVREVAPPGGGVNVQITYQTAPTADEALFTTIGGPIVLSAGTVTVTPMLGTVAAAPLGRYLRWLLNLSGASAGTWDATFRIFLAMNRPGYRTPAYMAATAKHAWGAALPLPGGVQPLPHDNQAEAIPAFSVKVQNF